MISFFEKNIGWLLISILIGVLWLIQWHALYYPYFWDEMGVYAYGVNYLLEHGISLFPKALPPDISRGHPLLIFGLYASFLKIVGNSLFAAHSLALIISSLTIVASYRLARFFVPPLMAVLAVLLLASQNIFLAQSTLVLPEMLVTLLSVLAFNCYFRKKYWWCILCLCLGVLVKESMILTAGFIGLVFLLQVILSGDLKKSWITLLAFSTPLVVLIIFLMFQKAQNGWYFFPYHTDLVSEGVLAGFKTKFKEHFLFVFNAQGRLLWFPFLFISAITAGFFSKRNKALLILISFIGFSIFLFSLAFYMDRYLLYVYPLICVVIVGGIFFLFKQSAFSYLLLLLLCGFSSYHVVNPSSDFRYDANLIYHKTIACHRLAVDDLCKPTSPRKIYANFPINMSLWEPYLGYANQSCLNTIQLVQNIHDADQVLLFSATISEEERLALKGNFVLNTFFADCSGNIQTYIKTNLSEE